jgi:hypothetical protein
MYIYQNGKLYARKGDKLVGVDFCSDQAIPVEGTECELAEKYQDLSLYEVLRKFQIIDGKDYKFPREVEVIPSEPIKSVVKPKRTPRKSVSK